MKPWSKDHDKCVNCGTVETPHGAKGLCDRCYRRQHRKAQYHNLESYRNRQLGKAKEYRAANKEKLKAYNKKRYQRDRDKLLARAKQKYKDNPEEAKRIREAYNAKFPGGRKEINAKYRKPKLEG